LERQYETATDSDNGEERILGFRYSLRIELLLGPKNVGKKVI